MVSKGDFEKILVRAPNWIGDAVMCLPALRCLKDLYPRAGITVLAKKRVIPVFENNPGVKEIMEYDDGERHRGLRGRLRLSGELKERGFDLAVLFQNAFDAAFISSVARIPERVGYARDLRTRLLTRPVPFTDRVKGLHHVSYYINIIRELGGECDSLEPRIHITDDELGGAKGLLEKEGLAGTPLVGAAPGASFGPAKRWPPESFARLLARVAEEFGPVPLVFGGNEDAGICEEVSFGLSKRGVRNLNLAGRITLREFMALAKGLKLFITNDSGPMHISAALGVPTLAIFGSTDPVLTGPIGNAVRIVKKEMECSPCFDRECRFGHYDCLASITPEEVYSEAEAFLSPEVS